MVQLVARRQAAFDQSPLNVCKLRSLYRTLLTVDFAAKTEERPGEDRAYTINEWHAYRKSQYGSQAHEAHEIIDQFWLSPAVSTWSFLGDLQCLLSFRYSAYCRSWMSLR
jgi:hypothetical protein